MTDISAAIGKRIRTFRNAQGISLEELSFKADLNAAHLGQIERGLRNPTIETLNRIATALDISFYELIGSVEEVPQKQPETKLHRCSFRRRPRRRESPAARLWKGTAPDIL